MFFPLFPARLSLFYHAGVSYFVLRRYRDAARVMSRCVRASGASAGAAQSERERGSKASVREYSGSHSREREYSGSLLAASARRASNLLLLCSLRSPSQQRRGAPTRFCGRNGQARGMSGGDPPKPPLRPARSHVRGGSAADPHRALRQVGVARGLPATSFFCARPPLTPPSAAWSWPSTLASRRAS
jgi:hypothetical protein